MKKVLLSLIAIIVITSTLSAQWISPGNGETYSFGNLVSISEGTVTSSEEGFFTINQDLTISSGDVLLFESSLKKITVANGITILIQGNTDCEQPDDFVLFTGISEANADGHFNFQFEDATNSILNDIIFENGSGIKVTDSQVTFDKCEFRYFNTAFSSSVVNYFRCGPTVKNCYFHDNQGAALSSGANIMGSPKIYNNIFYNNVLANTNTPQLNLGPGSEDTIYIIGNQIIGVASTMSGGLAIADLVNTGSTKALISHNIIRNNRYGYTQNGYTVSSVISDNIFENNNLETNPMNGGSGISIYGTTTNCSAIIRRNIITGNLWGITAIYYHNVDLGTAEDPGNNVFYNNGNGGVTYELYNNAFSDMTAIGNYWGSNDEAYAETVITHKPDQSNLGTVTYLPIKQLFPNILSFAFTMSDNPQLVQDYIGIINEEEHTIKVEVSGDAGDFSSLIPYFTTDLGVITSPMSGIVTDFSEPVTISVSTPHGTTQDWIVTVSYHDGIENQENNTVSIYPNPVTNNNLTINTNEMSENVKISIFNICGQCIYEDSFSGHTTINTASWQTGIYVVMVNNGNSIKTSKVIVTNR